METITFAIPHKAIAIAGSSGTGKGAAAGIISEQLGWPIVSAGNIMRAEAERLGITLAELKKKTHGDQFLDFWLDSTTRLAVFEKNGVIVEGRLVAFTVPSTVFRVLLILRDELRYERIAKRDNQTTEEAKEATQYREKVQAERYKEFYGLDFKELFDPQYYHLVVNTEANSPEVVAKLILESYELHQKGRLPEPAHRSLPIF